MTIYSDYFSQFRIQIRDEVAKNNAIYMNSCK